MDSFRFCISKDVMGVFLRNFYSVEVRLIVRLGEDEPTNLA